MAQATFSWPFGPIHLEKHQGAAQLTSFRSITAAAEGLVTFQFCSSWQKARLLACLGSSAAQWNGGYENCCVFAGPNVLIGSIPGGPVCRPYGMAWGGASGRPRPTWDGILGTGRSGTRPCGEFGNGPFFFVGAGHWPARRRASAIPEPTLIRLAYARHLPLKGKAVGRGVDPPLQFSKIFPGLGRGGPWASRRQRTRCRLLGKPRRRNGAAEPGIFAYPGPSGPAGIQTSRSDFARRKCCKIQQVRVPRNGVRGKATMSTKCSSEPSPVAFCLLCRHGQSRSPPAGGETPLQINKQGKTARTQTRK